MKIAKESYIQTEDHRRRSSLALISLRDYSHIRNLSEPEKAYIAGIIDGEGYISMHYKNFSKSRVKDLKLVLIIVNTNKDLINYIKSKLINGSAILRRNKIPHRKDSWRFVTSQIVAKEIIKAVYPYLIIKRKQADLALSFMENRFKGVEEQMEYKKKFLILNRRGKEV